MAEYFTMLDVKMKENLLNRLSQCKTGMLFYHWPPKVIGKQGQKVQQK